MSEEKATAAEVKQAEAVKEAKAAKDKARKAAAVKAKATRDALPQAPYRGSKPMTRDEMVEAGVPSDFISDTFDR